MFPGVELERMTTETPRLYSENALWDTGAQVTVISDKAVDTYEVVEADSYDGFVSIRAEKSSQSRELGRLQNGEFADFLEYDGEWYKINYEGITGYVYGKFAKKSTMIDP